MSSQIVLITRLGAGQVRSKLPLVIRALQVSSRYRLAQVFRCVVDWQCALHPLDLQAARFGAPLVWTCDPMHGNTRVTSSGIKTREFDDILSELRYVAVGETLGNASM